MSLALLRCIGYFGLGGGILVVIGMVLKNDFVEFGGLVVCFAASIWLAFLAKPESDELKRNARKENKIP